jgi:hypothetical protein
VPLGYLFNKLLTKNGVREECARCFGFSTISDDFLDSPTLNPLAPAQSKHRFSILAPAPEKLTKSDELENILDAFWFQFQDFGSLAALLVRSPCQGYANHQTSARYYIKPEAKVYLSDKAYD